MVVLHQHHTGMIVEDIEAALAFFELLGFETEKPSRISGDWIDRVNGLDETEIDLAWVRVPDGSGAIELTRFRSPVDGEGDATAPANRSGFRHLAFVVDDVNATVATLAEEGYPVLREVVDYEDTYRLCYVRGPEGMIFEFTEELGAAHS
jgi:catechol 2,3-dioxygenase-like lactoylglutathione lyase family enzyme